MLALCEPRTVISLDVFDTLLYRTVEPPDFLKRRAASYVAQRLSMRGFPMDRDLFLFLRAEAENRLRRRALQNGADSECKLSAIIYQAIDGVLGPKIAAEETEQSVEYEIAVECQYLRVAPGAMALLESLRSRGKRIIVASDTYLEKRHLEQIFRHLQIDHYIDAIYASSEYCAGKYSGRLFRKILEVEAIEPSEAVHIGDNYESDVRGAIKSGVPAILLFNISRRRQRSRLARRTSRLLAGREVMQLSEKPGGPVAPCDPSLDHDELFTIGRDIIGPAFCLFLLQVIEECYRWGVSDIYFLAREGFLFRKIHEALVENIQRFRCLPPIRDRYLYVSRLATSLPSIRQVGKRELSLALFRNRSASLRDCLMTFGLDPSEFSDLLPTLELTGQKDQQRLFSDPRFVERVCGRAEQQRSQLRSYLKSENFFARGDTKAFVDIGWHGTIQANLTHAFYDDPEFPTLLGLYFGRRYNQDYDYALSSRSIFLPGFIHDQNRHSAAEKPISYCLQIFEITASAPHGATVRYEETTEGARPVISPSPTKLSREQEVLQAGILDHAAAFAKEYNNYELDMAILQAQVTRRLAGFILKPKVAQVRALQRLVHAVDWGSNDTVPLVATDLTVFSIFTPARLINSLRHSFWAEGSLRMSRIPGVLVLLALVRRVRESYLVYQRLGVVCLSLFRRRSAPS